LGRAREILLSASTLRCVRLKWQNREAYRLTNGLVELVALTGGGHLPEFRFVKGSGVSSANPFWTAPWPTIDPQKYTEREHAERYGSRGEGRLLGGLAGHSICLDYFGAASKEEVANGLSFHGEAPNRKWIPRGIKVTRDSAELTLSVDLPASELRMSRRMKILPGESVVRFTETLENLKQADHYYQWAEHVTLGSSFLNAKDSYTVIPAGEGTTDPNGYDEGKELLARGRRFRWPFAPAAAGGHIDLSRPFARKGKGYVTSQLLQSTGKGDTTFIAAINARLGLLIGYIFSRCDFPWVVLWEENAAIEAKPWNGRTQARGLEFSNTPFPNGRQAAILQGSFQGLPTLSRIPSRGQRTVSFCAFLAELPQNFGKVQSISTEPEAIRISSRRTKSFLIPSVGLGRD
jgi:hypothetical protein